jgi:hypothetical protein
MKIWGRRDPVHKPGTREKSRKDFMSDAAGCMKLIIAGFNAELFISNPSPACIMVC